MAAWQDAVQETAGGVRLLLEVQAGAREARFPDGHNPWRGRLGMRVRAPAQAGAANEEVVRGLAGFFGLAPSQVRLESGQAQPRKSALLARLRPALEGP